MNRRRRDIDCPQFQFLVSLSHGLSFSALLLLCLNRNSSAHLIFTLAESSYWTKGGLHYRFFINSPDADRLKKEAINLLQRQRQLIRRFSSTPSRPDATPASWCGTSENEFKMVTTYKCTLILSPSRLSSTFYLDLSFEWMRCLDFWRQNVVGLQILNRKHNSIITCPTR